MRKKWECKNINAEWLNKKITQHYKDKRAFANDPRNAFTYSMITKHTSEKSEEMTDRYKNHYYVFFLCLENGLI